MIRWDKNTTQLFIFVISLTRKERRKKTETNISNYMTHQIKRH